MKVNNETKVGAIALIAVIILILGFNYLKGTSLFDGTFRLYSEYENVDGLTVGSKVLINGMQIGQVNALTFDLETHKVRVDLSLSVNDLKVPDDSKAMVYSVDLLGTKAINIVMGKSTNYLEDEGRIGDSLSTSFANQVQKELMPLKLKVEGAVTSIDSLVTNLNLLFDETNKNNLSASILNLRNTTGRLDTAMDKVDHMLASARSIIKNFESNNENIKRIMQNSAKFTDTLAAQSDKIKSLITNAESSVKELKAVMEKINRGEGSLGLLINDKKLYNNLTASAISLDSLFVDLKRHPKRYVHFSVFGRKESKPSSQ